MLGFLDMRTIFFTMVLTYFVCALVMLLLWKQNHKRLDGITYWVADFTLQTITVLLIVLRGGIPDWLSIGVANMLSMTGIYLGFLGLEKFFHLKSSQVHNYLLLLLFPILIFWTIYGVQDLALRNLIISIFSFLFCIQCVWLVFFRVQQWKSQTTILVGLSFAGYCFVDVIRIVDYFVNEHSLNDYLKAGTFEDFVMLSFEMLFILLTFGLALMFNKRLLNDISVQEEKFSKAFHTSPYAISLTRMSDGQILEINDTFQRFVGYKAQDIIGQNTLLLGFWENPDDRAFVLNELTKNRVVRDMEFNFRKKNGDRLYGLFSAEILNVNGEACILSSVNDISKRKKAEEELKVSEAKFKELNATKDKFFSIIAHDLRSPFSSILGFSELMIDSIREKEYERVEEFATIIHKSTTSTMDLLMNLLEWSRSQTGRLDFSPEYFELKVLTNEVIGLFSQSAIQKTIDLKMDQFPNATVFADRLLVSTILRNLISNAIKFTQPGGEIKMSAKQQENQLVVSVCDNGTGIKKEDQKKLFLIEESYSKIGTQNEMGTGLGLLLCKEFVEKHGGRLWVDSTPDVGSTFYFTLPTSL